MASAFSALTNLVSGSGKGFFDVKLPGFSLTGGIETCSIQSIGQAASSVVESAQNLMQVGRMAYCAGKMLTNPSMALGVLNVLGNNLLAAVTDMASRLATLMKGQINQAISQVTGSITGLINNALGFLGSILSFI